MNGASQNITENQKVKLKELFPEVFTEDKIDFDKLKVALGEQVDIGERYSLTWKGKSNVFRAIQETTTKTLKPVREESVDFDKSKNIFIEGDNLDALKVLQKSYYGKVKMIYIDPPYNTGNDFVYNDKFAQSQEEYAQEAGIKDKDGNLNRTDGLRKNSKDGGHFHSNWLNMMYPRLYLARNLLRQDGVIFVSIDDNEVHNLRMMMNEIFGEDNFIAQLIWEKKYSTSNNIKGISYTHEYILCFVRDSSHVLDAIGRYAYTPEARARFKNPDNDPRGDWSDMSYHGPKSPTERPNLNYAIINPKTGQEIWPKEKSWAYEKAAYEKHVQENRLWWGKDGNYKEPRIKKFFSEIQGGLIPKSILNYKEFGTTSEGRSDFRYLFGKNDEGAIFDNPKPVRLIQKLCEISTNKDSLVMDFFCGSGTTADAVMRMNAEDGGNRRVISVQLPELTEPNSEANLAGYKYISDIAKERIRKSSKLIKDKVSDANNLDLGFKVMKLDDTNFNVWDSSLLDQESLKKQIAIQLHPIKDNSTEEDLLFEIVLKEGIDPTTEMHKTDNYWVVGDMKYIVCLDKVVTKDDFQSMINQQPKKVILLDNALQGDDELKANIVLQADKSNIELQVI